MNNLYINLGDGNRIRIVWSCSSVVNAHNVNIFHKNLATGRPVAKTLIKYNSNSLEENDEEEKDQINIELTSKKTDPEMMKILLTDDRIYKKKTRKILLWQN